MSTAFDILRSGDKKFRYLKGTSYVLQDIENVERLQQCDLVLALVDSPFYKYGQRPDKKQFEFSSLLTRVGLLCPIVTRDQKKSNKPIILTRSHYDDEFDRYIDADMTSIVDWTYAGIGKLGPEELFSRYKNYSRLSPKDPLNAFLLGFIFIPKRIYHDWLMFNNVVAPSGRDLDYEVQQITGRSLMSAYSNIISPELTHVSAQFQSLKIFDTVLNPIYNLFICLQAATQRAPGDSGYGHNLAMPEFIDSLTNIYAKTNRIFQHLITVAREKISDSRLRWDIALPSLPELPPFDSFPLVSPHRPTKSLIVLRNTLFRIAYNETIADQGEAMLPPIVPLHYYDSEDTGIMMLRNDLVKRGLMEKFNEVVTQMEEKLRAKPMSKRQEECQHNSVLRAFLKHRNLKTYRSLASFFADDKDPNSTIKCTECRANLICPHVTAVMSGDAEEMSRYAVSDSVIGLAYCSVCSEFLYDIAGISAGGTKQTLGEKELAINLERYLVKIIGQVGFSVTLPRSKEVGEDADMRRFVVEAVNLLTSDIETKYHIMNREGGDASIKALKRKYYAAMSVFSMLAFLAKNIPKAFSYENADFEKMFDLEITESAKRLNVGASYLKPILETHFEKTFGPGGSLRPFVENLTGKELQIREIADVKEIPRYQLMRFLNDNAFIRMIFPLLKDSEDSILDIPNWPTCEPVKIMIPNTPELKRILLQRQTKQAQRSQLDLFAEINIPDSMLRFKPSEDDSAVSSTASYAECVAKSYSLLLRVFMKSGGMQGLENMIQTSRRTIELVYGMGLTDPPLIPNEIEPTPSTLVEVKDEPIPDIIQPHHYETVSPLLDLEIKHTPTDEKNAADEDRICRLLNLNSLAFQPFYDANLTHIQSLAYEFLATNLLLIGNEDWHNRINGKYDEIHGILTRQEAELRSALRKCFVPNDAVRILGVLNSLDEIEAQSGKKIAVLRILFDIWSKMLDIENVELIAKFIKAFIETATSACFAINFVIQPNVYSIGDRRTNEAANMTIENEDEKRTVEEQELNSADEEEEGDEQGEANPLLTTANDEEEDIIENSPAYDD
jgi:hypothetical protein